MHLKLASDSDLWGLVDELKRGFSDRDNKWPARRLVRFRRMEDRLKTLPLNPRVSDTALMVHQSEVPNQEAHLRVKRLVANKPRFEVVIYEDDPKQQQLGQDLEDGLKALYKWVNRGKVSFDWIVTQFQQGDGLGIGKLVWVPGHGDTLAAYDPDKIAGGDEDDKGTGAASRNKARRAYRDALASYKSDDVNREAKAYDKATASALRKELPPVRFVAVDPLRCYWWADDDGIEVITEVGEKRLNPLLAAFKGYGLRLDPTGAHLYVDKDGSDVVGEGSSELHARKDLASRVTYVEIRTRHEIAILIEHPKIAEKAPRGARSDTERGVTLRFANPFGPYTTGYVLVPGDVTTEDDEADKYQPPILAALNEAQSYNTLMTAQLSAALEAALAAPYASVREPVQGSISDEDKAPEQAEGEIAVIPGEIKRIEAPGVELERVRDNLVAESAPYRFREALQGEATSDTSGHRLAIQVSQADLQMVPYQNARADAIKEMMMGVLYAVRRHGLTVYIPTLPDGTRQGSAGQLRVMDQASLRPEMADLNFDLIVTLGAETPTTKYAKQAALRDAEEAGIIGYESVVEQSGAENPQDEIRRVFVGKTLKAVMETTIPQLAESISKAIQQRITDFMAGGAPLAPPQGELPFGPPPESGLTAGGGSQLAMQFEPRLPGVNMPPAPYTSELGPSSPEVAGLGAVPLA